MKNKLTLSKLMECKRKLDEVSIKPFKGFVGLNRNGFFQIKTQKEFEKLKEIKA